MKGTQNAFNEIQMLESGFPWISLSRLCAVFPSPSLCRGASPPCLIMSEISSLAWFQKDNVCLVGKGTLIFLSVIVFTWYLPRFTTDQMDSSPLFFLTELLKNDNQHIIYSFLFCFVFFLCSSAGFGFVTFENEDVVEKVCEIHFHEINNKMVSVLHFAIQQAMLPGLIFDFPFAAALMACVFWHEMYVDVSYRFQALWCVCPVQEAWNCVRVWPSVSCQVTVGRQKSLHFSWQRKGWREKLIDLAAVHFIKDGLSPIAILVMTSLGPQAGFITQLISQGHTPRMGGHFVSVCRIRL